MTDGIPSGARPAARVLVLGDDAVLLLEARDRTSHWWIAPGGGLEPGESFEQAARREALEETGLALTIGPWVWTRRHVYEMEGRRFDQYERYFLAHTERVDIRAPAPDHYVVGARWWTLAELERTRDDLAPRRLAVLIRPILAGVLPAAPFDCGV